MLKFRYEMTTSEFPSWLQSELDSRNWSQSDLARESGIKPASISRVLMGTRKPGTEMCLAIAKAFKMPAENIFRQAGLLPPNSDPDPETHEAAHLFARLGAYDRRQVLDDMRRRLEQENYQLLREAQEVYALIGQEQTKEALDLVRKWLDELKEQGYKQVK